MNEKRNIIGIIAAILILLTVSIGVSLSYFTAALSGGETATTIVVGGGIMRINFSGGSVININNIFPGSDIVTTKTFTVTGNNTTDLIMPYTVNLVVDENGFSTNALKYTLTSTNTSNSGTPVPSIISQTNIPSGTGTYSLGDGVFVKGVSKVHTYALNIYFPETISDQNGDQGKKFKAHVALVGDSANNEFLVDAIISQEVSASAISAKGNPDFKLMSPAPVGATTEIITFDSATQYYFAKSFTFNGAYNLVGAESGYYNMTKVGYYTLKMNSSDASGTTIYYITENIDNTQARGYAFTDQDTITLDTGIYASLDDYGTSYYYRGESSILNNNVVFNGMQWKIIRVNGDGSIRLIYNGLATNYLTYGIIDNTVPPYLEDEVLWVEGLTTSNDNKYFGYMYGGLPNDASASLPGAVSNDSDSPIKMIIDAWYNTNFVAKGDSITGKIIDNIFCNDRTIASLAMHSFYEIPSVGLGYGTGSIVYAAADRLLNSVPSLKCTNVNDRFTVQSSAVGNKALTYPVGLISADEALFAGKTSKDTRSLNYLTTDKSYWTMTPYLSLGSNPYIYSVNGPGNIEMNSEKGMIRPVINLSPSVMIYGSGSLTDPFVII